MTRLEYVILGLIYEAALLAPIEDRPDALDLAHATIEVEEEIRLSPYPRGFTGGQDYPYRSPLAWAPVEMRA